MICFCTAARQVIPDCVCIEGAVEQEGGAGFRVLEHVDALEERELVAGDEVGAADEIAGADRLGTEAQVRSRQRAGLLRVVHEVALRVVLRVFADDLDGVLVGADGSVRAQAVEQSANCACIFGGERRIVVDAGVRYVVDDADGEVILAATLCELVEYALDHRGREFFRREAVATADDLGERLQRQAVVRAAFAERGDDVHVERFAS